MKRAIYVVIVSNYVVILWISIECFHNTVFIFVVILLWTLSQLSRSRWRLDLPFRFM